MTPVATPQTPTRVTPLSPPLRLRASLILLLLTALLPSLACGQTVDAANAAISSATHNKLTDKVFNRHIEGLGFILWGQNTPTGQALIGQVRGTGGPDHTLDARANPTKDSLPDPVLKLPGSPGLNDFVLILRLQNSLDVDESKAQAATYQWIGDANLGSYWNLDAAAILDWYFPLDKETPDRLRNFFAYRPDKRAAHLRTGFAWERITAGSASTSVDLREIFVGIGYRRLLNQGKKGKPEPDKEQSEFQIGLNYKDNAVTNDSQWSVDLNVQPVFKLFHGIPFLNRFEKYFPKAIGEHWAWGRQDPPVASDPGHPTIEPTQVEVASANSPLEQLRQYVYIKPNFSLKSVFSDFSKSGSVNPGDYQVDWGTRFGVGFMHDAFRVSYLISGVSPLEHIGSSFVYQEARAEYRPTIDSPIVFSARYSKGKRAPSYINEDRVVLAVGVKF